MDDELWSDSLFIIVFSPAEKKLIKTIMERAAPIQMKIKLMNKRLIKNTSVEAAKNFFSNEEISRLASIPTPRISPKAKVRPSSFIVPTVLKTAVFAKDHGRMKILKNCKISKTPKTASPPRNISTDITKSRRSKDAATRYARTENKTIEAKLSKLDQVPMKLANELTEKKLDKNQAIINTARELVSRWPG